MDRTVLVVDDFYEVHAMLKESLAAGGRQLVEAADGVEAVRQAHLTRPDLTIMCINARA